MKYRVLAPAVRDLLHIENWVSANFGERASERATQRLLKTFSLLAEFQELGKERFEVFPPPMRFYFERPNWVAYKPGTPLVIHRVFPARMSTKHFHIDPAE